MIKKTIDVGQVVTNQPIHISIV